MNFDCWLTVLLMEARARVDHGVEVECRKLHENRAADRGCVSRLVVLLLFVVAAHFSVNHSASCR
jgi:hypothetical protein